MLQLEVNHLVKTFTHESHPEPVEILKGLSMKVHIGDTVAIVGQSGSGKSTLLSLLAALDQPTSGEILLQDHHLSRMSETELARFRAQNIGIVFQQYHLMPHLTALENVSLPLELAHKNNVRQQALEALGKVGMIHRTDHFPHQLSGGECQRVALARAIVIQPLLLLADEPTGNLDQETGDYIIDLLFEVATLNEMTMILVTHNRALASRCQYSLTLKGGVLH